MKNIFLLIMGLSLTLNTMAQDDSTQTKKKITFKKDHLFTGGGVILSFSSNVTVLGASPVFGYSVTKWLDAGLAFSYVYASQRHYPFYSYDDKLEQTTV